MLYARRYLDELQKLQDRCPQYSSESALRVFEDEIGRKFDDVFIFEGDLKPIAAASIGQVIKTKRLLGFRTTIV